MLKFTLEKAAKKSGGDKYKANDDFGIYLPQSISRPNGNVKPFESFSIDFDDSGIYKFKLSQQAKKAGGDKYLSENDSNFSIYFPQSISRPTNKVKTEIAFNLITE